MDADKPETDLPMIPKPPSSKALHRTGFVLTAVWLTLLAAYITSRSDAVFGLNPNELGDFASGAFAPLAFLWLVLGFFQQGQELRHSGEALWLQGRELQLSVEQQRELVEVTREQLTFESTRTEAQRLEAARNAMPVLDIGVGGNSPHSDGLRRYDFTLVNAGKQCTRVEIREAGLGALTAADILPTGGRVGFSLILPPKGDIAHSLSVTYLDSRSDPGEKQFLLRRENGRFTATAVNLATA